MTPEAKLDELEADARQGLWARLDPSTVLALVAECRELRRMRAVLDFLYRNETVPEVRPAAELIGLALSLGWKETT